ncbi:hypothetical protein KL86DES1_10680 [uncultured Desulfovibrio sp.]|uniref:Uncharacterized protein n=1 Tax=uncultured Desulfovibrio sp. TaxID=167968 RepID=A0A212L043_9BACT|nr:hypothetical protein KL86DES1_10680 [uncultured Desulfovibrio sp.]
MPKTTRLEGRIWHDKFYDGVMAGGCCLCPPFQIRENLEVL